MEDTEVFQEFYDSHFEFEESFSKYDELLDELKDIRSFKSISFEPTDSQKEEKIENEETDEEETVITASSNESIDTTFKSESIESLESLVSREIYVGDELESLNIYESYPIPVNLGLLSAFWILYPEPPVYKSDGIDKFFDTIKSSGLMPLECLREQLKSDRVILKYYGVDSEVIKVLCDALLSNTRVKILNLQESLLTTGACNSLNQLLLRNTALKSLNLTNCKIGVEGAMKLEEGISMSSALRELNLSRCDLGNEGFSYIAKAVSANSLLESLNISFNNLDEGSAEKINKMLLTTDSLKTLNISWNNFCTKVATENLFGGLVRNRSITNVDASWNSMTRASVFHISNYITNSKSVKYLNLAANRFTDADILVIAQALIKNRTLQELVLDRNPIGSKGITDFIRVLVSNQFSAFSPLLVLDFQSFWATKQVVPALEQLEILKPKLNIKLSGILENYTIVGPNLKELFFMTANYESMNTKKKKDRKNFGHFVLSLGDSRMKKEKFRELVEERKIKISSNLVTQIMNQFLVTKKSFDQAALKESYMSFFPDTKLPPPPQPKVKTVKTKKKGKKKGKKSKKKTKGSTNKKKKGKLNKK